MKFWLIIDTNEPYLHKTSDKPYIYAVVTNKLLKYLIFLLLLPVLEGCISTVIPSPLRENAEQKAAASIDRIYSYVGHQYLLVFPFGRVYVDGPTQVLQEFTSAKHDGAAIPQVLAASLRLSAYDLFFTRYMVCTLTATTRCQAHGEVLYRSSTRYTEYSRYGFENDLSRVWYRCLKEAEGRLCSSS